MRRLVISLGFAAVLAVIAVQPLPAAPVGQAAQADDALRFVQIIPTSAAEGMRLARTLEMHGFKREGTGTEVLSGRLPGKSIETVAALEGVWRVLVGPAVPAMPVVRPASYQVRLRFRIDAARQQRWERYQEMLKELQAAGFVKDKGLENEFYYSDFMTGTVPASGADRLHLDPLVQTVILVPTGHRLPPEPANLVMLELQLLTRLGAARQAEVADRTRAMLRSVNFVEAAGYDHRGHTRMLGWIPAGQFQPGAMEQPAPVLNPELQIKLRAPGKNAFDPEAEPVTVQVTPVKRIMVIPEPSPAAAEPPAPPAIPNPKVSPDLHNFIASLPEAERTKPIRVEVIVNQPPAGDPRLGLPITIEGFVGPLVTGWVAPAEIEQFASLPVVSTVRLPQAARTLILPPLDLKQPGQLPVEFVPLGRSTVGSTGLAALVRRRTPQRVAVIGSDFRGWEALQQNGMLPKKTQLLDVTAELSLDLRPTPPLPGDAIGSGTRLALALQAEAKADEMLLLRIDPAAPYQIPQLARVLQGQTYRSNPLDERADELRRDKNRLDRERLELRIERRTILNQFQNLPESVRNDEQGRKVREEWNAYLKRQAEHEATEKTYREKHARYLDRLYLATPLKDITTVLVALSWPEGQPHLPGQQAGLRYVDPALFRGVSWIQTLPRVDDQVWTGMFRDTDQDGVMEFTAGDSASGRRPDLNFLAWRYHPWSKPAGSKGEVFWQELPANTPGVSSNIVVQVTVQWREIHSAGYKEAAADDVYRRPIVPVQISVLRQRDPLGRELPVDAFEVVARSTSLPDRLESGPRHAVYQQTVRFVVEKPGRYAVRLFGHSPESTRPPGSAKLPTDESWELQPRLKVEALEPARAQGNVVFETYQ